MTKKLFERFDYVFYTTTGFYLEQIGFIHLPPPEKSKKYLYFRPNFLLFGEPFAPLLTTVYLPILRRSMVLALTLVPLFPLPPFYF